MTFINQLVAQRQNQDSTMSQSNAQYAEESAKLREQAAMEALWRMADGNAMAKIKGFSKLMETANQL